jgi:hypothetical protein
MNANPAYYSHTMRYIGVLEHYTPFCVYKLLPSQSAFEKTRAPSYHHLPTNFIQVRHISQAKTFPNNGHPTESTSFQPTTLHGTLYTVDPGSRPFQPPVAAKGKHLFTYLSRTLLTDTGLRENRRLACPSTVNSYDD